MCVFWEDFFSAGNWPERIIRLSIGPFLFFFSVTKKKRRILLSSSSPSSSSSSSFKARKKGKGRGGSGVQVRQSVTVFPTSFSRFSFVSCVRPEPPGPPPPHPENFGWWWKKKGEETRRKTPQQCRPLGKIRNRQNNEFVRHSGRFFFAQSSPSPSLRFEKIFKKKHKTKQTIKLTSPKKSVPRRPLRSIELENPRFWLAGSSRSWEKAPFFYWVPICPAFRAV